MDASPHLSNQQLADCSLIDGEHQSGAADGTGAHLQSCALCAARVAELARMVSLFQGLPDEVPPRDFRLGPRLLGQVPPRAHRLLQWYTWTRAAAASAAAISILLVGADLALPPGAATRVVPSPPTALKAPAGGSAESARLAPPPVVQPAAPAADSTRSTPTPAGQPVPPAAAPAAQAPDVAPDSGRSPPAPAAQAARPAAGGAGPAPAPGESAPSGSAGADSSASSNQPEAPPDVGDQRAAATGVQPLPTPLPPPAAAVARLPATNGWGPYRVLAVLAGLLAFAAAGAAFVVRSRLTRTVVPPPSTPGGHPS